MENFKIGSKTRKRIGRSLLSLAISSATLGVTNMALAQETDGSVRGTVQGATSGTIVEIESTTRGTVRSNNVSSGGEFRIDGLSPGSY